VAAPPEQEVFGGSAILGALDTRKGKICSGIGNGQRGEEDLVHRSRAPGEKHADRAMSEGDLGGGGLSPARRFYISSTGMSRIFFLSPSSNRPNG